ncbi:Hypothetical predicted protein, partial [Marmota monax]
PDLIGANTERGAAEFRLPEPSRNRPGPGLRSLRRLLLGPCSYQSIHQALSGRIPAPGTEPAGTASWSLLLSELTPSTERPSSGTRNCPGPGLGAHGNCFSVRVLLRAGQDSPVALVARQGERNAAIRIGYQHGRDLMSSESGGGENFINTSGDRNSRSPGRG